MVKMQKTNQHMVLFGDTQIPWQKCRELINTSLRHPNTLAEMKKTNQCRRAHYAKRYCDIKILLNRTRFSKNKTKTEEKKHFPGDKAAMTSKQKLVSKELITWEQQGLKITFVFVFEQSFILGWLVLRGCHWRIFSDKGKPIKLKNCKNKSGAE